MKSIDEANKKCEQIRAEIAVFGSVPFLSYSIKGTECFKVKRGLNQRLLTLNFEEDIKGVRFDQPTQSFLILFDKKITVLSKDAKILKTIKL